MADVATLQLKVDSTQVIKGEDALEDFTQAGAKAENQVEDLNASTKKLGTPLKSVTTNMAKTTKASGNLANTAKQTAFQLSQIAQQGAASGDFLRATAIQIPDLLLPFGTLAIVIGAVAGALGPTFIEILTGASAAVEGLGDEINELNDDFSTLTETQQAFLVSASNVRQLGIRDQIQGLDDDIKSAERSLKRAQGGTFNFGGRNRTLRADPEAIKEANQELLELNALRDTANQKLEKEAQLQKDIAAGVNEKVKAERDSLSLSLASVQGGFDPVVAAQQSFERRNDIIQRANEQSLVSQEEFDALRVENAKKLQEDLTNIERTAAKDRNALLTTSQRSTAAATGQFFGNLAQIAQAGGKDQFDNYKNLASAQAGISAALAVASVLGDPTLPTALKIPFATSIGALAAVQIGQIQSQEYQPRALGGQMKAGGSFLVGERGPELVTMGNRNANITPNNQLGGGEPIQLTNVFQISTGVAETAQAEIARALPLIEKLAVNAVNSAARKGGATSRIVGAR